MPIDPRTIPLPELGRYGPRLGPTPLVPLRLEEPEAPSAIWCKLEFLNPSGSTKDRIARYILEKAWREGRIGPGSRVIEASSGSTSIAMALACAQLGLRFTAVMPAGVSSERVWMIRAYGGEVALIDHDSGIAGAIAHAAELSRREGAFATNQFTNPDNAEAHRRGTGREIVEQIPGGIVDAVACGVGTGGTIVGLFAAFRDGGCPAIIPVLARPVTRKMFSDVECCSFSARVPGVAEGIRTLFTAADLPGLVEIEVDDELALATTRRLHAKGFPVGPSSGLNYAAAAAIAKRLGVDAQVVTVFPDRMERYFSTELFAAVRQEG